MPLRCARHRFLQHLPSDAAGNLIAFADGVVDGKGKGSRKGKVRARRSSRAESGSLSGLAHRIRASRRLQRHNKPTKSHETP